MKNLDKPNDLNEDPATVEWIRKLGPDTFQLRVDGAERFVVDEPSRYDPERCEYYFDFPLSNSGAVWLNGIHFYEVRVYLLFRFLFTFIALNPSRVSQCRITMPTTRNLDTKSIDFSTRSFLPLSNFRSALPLVRLSTPLCSHTRPQHSLHLST